MAPLRTRVALTYGGHAQRLETLALPRFNLHASHLHDPRADRNDPAGLLGNTDEPVGPRGSQRVVAPTKQSFDSDDVPVRGVPLGLVRKANSPRSSAFFLQGGREKLEVSRVAFLDVVCGHVSVLEQHLRRLLVLRQIVMPAPAADAVAHQAPDATRLWLPPDRMGRYRENWSKTGQNQCVITPPKGTFMKRISVLTAVSLACLASSNVNALAVAFADNVITNFTVTTSAPVSFFGLPTNTSESNATFTDSAPAGFADTQPLFLPANAPQSKSGPGPFPGEDNYALLAGSNLGMMGARADSNISAGNPANINNVAEASSDSSAIGAAGGRVTGGSVIDVTSPTTISLSFLEAYHTYANTSLIGESANASIGNTFEIRNSSNVMVGSFTPAQINASCGSNSGFPNPCESAGSAAFSFSTGLLEAGRYILDFRSTSQVDVRGVAAIPEPETYALILAGLGAVAFMTRRRRLNA